MSEGMLGGRGGPECEAAAAALDEIDWQSYGIEPTYYPDGARLDGWAVFANCEGDDPRFVAFMPRREDAEALLATMDAHQVAVGGIQVVVAMLWQGGLLTSDSDEIDTHDKLAAQVWAAMGEK